MESFHPIAPMLMKYPVAFLSFAALAYCLPVHPVLAQDASLKDVEVTDVEQRLKELGIDLPRPAAPVANYVGAIRTGNLVFLAGAGPRGEDGNYVTGRLGEDLDLDAGYHAARLAGISLLAALREEVGDLNRVTRIVKAFGMVNSHPSFTDQSKVMNGFSDLMVEVFGERGRHARAVAGMASLPLGFAVEVEMIVEVE